MDGVYGWEIGFVKREINGCSIKGKGEESLKKIRCCGKISTVDVYSMLPNNYAGFDLIKVPLFTSNIIIYIFLLKY